MKYCINSLIILSTLFPSVLFSLSEYRLICPKEIRSISTTFINAHDHISDSDLSQNLRELLVNNGYPFAQVDASKSNDILIVEVKTGFYGKATISGNNYLSDHSVIQNLNWRAGKTFNYSKFYTASSRLNRNRFIQVDTKLSPVRTKGGEIQVNADFKVQDKYPVSPYIKVSNDGTDQSSGWRSTVGAEVWESLLPNDRLNFSYTLDPRDSSKLSSYFASYQFGSSSLRHTLFAGYSDSEYENVVSSLSMDIAGDGFFTGYNGLLPLGTDSLVLSFGFSYLDLGSQISLGTAKYNEDLNLFLPRIGFQGEISNPGNLRGATHWSISAVSDLGITDEAELKIQNPELDGGFWVPKASIAFIEPVEILDVKGGLKLKVDGQASNVPLPTSLKKSIGGMSSIRGYREREAYGDSGVSMNFEYSINAESTSIFGLEGNLQKIFFYDAGYVSSEGTLTAANDSIGMQSFGAGLLGNLEGNTDLSLHVGIPLVDSLNTKAHDARTHFSINFRF